MTEINRRKFLTYVGTGAAALTVASAGLGGLAPKVEAKGRDAANNLFGFNKKVSGLNFKPIEPSDADDIVLPKGYKYEVVAAYGDKINEAGDTFGFNCDFTQYLPINGSSNHGLLWVNHEYSSDVICSRCTRMQTENTLQNKLNNCFMFKVDRSSRLKVIKKAAGR